MLNRAACHTATLLAMLVASAALAGPTAANRSTAPASRQDDPPLGIWLDIGQWWQDAFPANETIGLPGTTAFDTTSAWIKSGTNYAPGVTGSTRGIVPGDTTLVYADPSGPPIRVDLVFRILPGVGNYRSTPQRQWPPTAQMVLLRLPTDPVTAVVAGDSSFWGQYMAAPGEFGTSGGHYDGTRWDPLTWNSARCDSAERNVFPTSALSARVGGATGLNNQWASMYHESDPKFPVLGKVKFRCFHMDTSLAPTQLNVRCDGTLPAWVATVPASRTGWDGSNTTREYTKIIPDGLLTPGSHVEYLYRRSEVANPSVAELVPDTNRIVYQPGEASSDMHRWQHLSILPDRWKDSAFGGLGMACMLVVDAADRRGQEAAWVSAMDSLAERFDKLGAHNGWFAPGDVDLSLPENVAAYSVNRNAQPGTQYDLYDVKAAESPATSAGGIGCRFANRPPGQLITGKWGRSGPTAEMLRRYYRVVTLLTGDVPRELGANENNPSGDVPMLNSFLSNPGGTPQPRGLWVIGPGFAAAQMPYGFLWTTLGVRSAGTSYRAASGYAGDFCLMRDVSYMGRLWSTPADGEVLEASGLVTDVAPALEWGPIGLPTGRGAAMTHAATATENYVVRVDGIDFAKVRGAYSANTAMRPWYIENALLTTFSGVFGCPWGLVVGAPGAGSPATASLHLLGNPLRGSGTTVRLTLGKPDRVTLRIHDLGGRVVRTLVERAFAAGMHDVPWDGSDDAGRRLPDGVYFAHVTFAGGQSARVQKMVILR